MFRVSRFRLAPAPIRRAPGFPLKWPIALWLGMALAPIAAVGQQLPRVRLVTVSGTIEIEVDSIRAPRTAANFLRYVDGGFFRGGSFHRTVTLANQPSNPIKIEVIQAAADSAKRTQLFGPIELERTTLTGITHRLGTISMARGAPDSAQDQFFICLTDLPSLDAGGQRNPDGQGFAAFGRVTRGMDVVRAIQRSPADGQRLTPPIAITDATRIP